MRVLRAEPGDSSKPLRIRLNELRDDGAAALFQLDPIRDRDECNALLHMLREAPTTGFRTLEDALDALRNSGDEVLDLIRKRVENLGVDRMRAWAGQSTRTLADVWTEDRPRAVIADTSGFEGQRERLAVAVALLEQLWTHRMERRPLLLVVDEAHDVCPSEPIDPLQRLAVLAERYGFAPRDLVELAGSFGLGEALVAGPVAPAPLLAKVGARLTPEGGADVPTDWAG